MSLLKLFNAIKYRLTPLLLPNLLNISCITGWVKNKCSGIKGRVVCFMVIPIKGILGIFNAFRELLIRYILLLLYNIS